MATKRLKTVLPDNPERRPGKSRLRVHYLWAIAPDEDVAHLFWSLTGQSEGKAMCGGAFYTSFRPARTFAIGALAPVCPRCREIGLPGHPLPRGII